MNNGAAMRPRLSFYHYTIMHTFTKDYKSFYQNGGLELYQQELKIAKRVAAKTNGQPEKDTVRHALIATLEALDIKRDSALLDAIQYNIESHHLPAFCDFHGCDEEASRWFEKKEGGFANDACNLCLTHAEALSPDDDVIRFPCFGWDAGGKHAVGVDTIELAVYCCHDGCVICD